MESLARDKQSSLIGTFVNYGRKKFYNIGPWAGNHENTYELLKNIFVIKRVFHIGCFVVRALKNFRKIIVKFCGSYFLTNFS